VEKIRVARAHKVSRWFKEGLGTLVSGKEKITRADLQTLGAETAAIILILKEQLGNSSMKADSSGSFNIEDVLCGLCSQRLFPLHVRHQYPAELPFCGCCGYAPQELTLSPIPAAELPKKKGKSLDTKIPDIPVSRLAFQCCDDLAQVLDYWGYFVCASCHRKVSTNHPVVIPTLQSKSANMECAKLIEAEFQDEIAALTMD